MSQQKTKTEKQPESSKDVLVRSMKLAEESKQIGVNTLVKLDEQTEQMRRVQADAEDTEHIIKGNRRVVKDMRRCWVIRLCCYNRSDMLPDDPTWSNRDDPDEQRKVKKMIKLDKRRRRMRRLRKKEEKEGQSADGQPVSPSPKKSLWSFWKRSRSEDSDLSDISEDSEDEPQPPIDKAPQVKSNPKLIPEVNDFQIENEEDALDQLHSTVQDMKIIAMQISETANQQTSMLGGITAQVNTNQAQLDRNNKLVGKLGRRAKEDGDDGVLSAQDRLAIMGVKSALTSRMQ